MKFVEIIRDKEKKNTAPYMDVRALHDYFLFKKENRQLTERMVFLSTKFYLYSSLVVSILVFYFLEWYIFATPFTKFIIFDIVVLIFAILFWQQRRINFFLLDAIEKVLIEFHYKNKNS